MLVIKTVVSRCCSVHVEHGNAHVSIAKLVLLNGTEWEGNTA